MYHNMHAILRAWDGRHGGWRWGGGGVWALITSSEASSAVCTPACRSSHASANWPAFDIRWSV